MCMGRMASTKHVRIPERVYERAAEVQEEYGYPSIGEAIRHVFQEAGYDA